MAPKTGLVSPGEPVPVDGVSPMAVVRPLDAEGVARALREARAEGLGVVPTGGGTRLCLGNPPRPPFVLLDLRGLVGVVEHNAGNLTATFGAGITLESAQQALAPQGQFLPLEAPLPERSTLGGTLAVGWGGALGLAFGLPRDLVIGMAVVHVDGRVTRSGGRVVKNVTGYDMHRLYTGSLGTLAVVVEATLKLAPLPPAQATLVARFGQAPEALRLGLSLACSPLLPWAVEVVNGQAWPGPGGGNGAWRVVARFGGRATAVERCVREASALLAGARRDVLGPGEAGGLWRSLARLGWDEGCYLSVRLALPPSRLARHLPDLLAGEGLGAPAVAVHAGQGVARLAWHSTPGEPEVVARRVRALREQARALGGWATVVKAPVEVKRLLGDVWDDPGPSLAVMRRLKAEFDPQGTLNPGRFVGGL